MDIYQNAIASCAFEPILVGRVRGENASARAARLACGTFVRFSLRINDGVVEEARFESNGCGYMIAAADWMADQITGQSLVGLAGYLSEVAVLGLEQELGPFGVDRAECRGACIDAMRKVFADYRLRRIEEFRGEHALICTCFGITEDAIHDILSREASATVEDVMSKSNAGRGCGSCRMVIQEMIDTR